MKRIAVILCWSFISGVLTLGAVPLSIDFQPKDQTVILYQQAVFGVIASGTASLAYQWRKEGVPIAGATNDQIVLAHAQFSDAGSYSVVVSNAEGSVNSAEAALTVSPPKAGDLDYSFVWGGSINGAIEALIVQPDGKVLIAGYFTSVHGAVRSGIARLNADGRTDYTFMNGLSGVSGAGGVSTVAIQSDGKVLIGCCFTGVDGVSRSPIARLNVDGTLDSTFQNGLSETDGYVTSIAAQRDGKILIGGRFTRVNGESRINVARLNCDGTLDSGFQNGLSGADFPPFGGSVTKVVVQSDGKMLIAGYFTKVNGVSRTNIAKLNVDGTLDTTFVPVAVAGAPPIAIQSDGKVVAGNIRLNPDGSLDSSFQNRVSVFDGVPYFGAVQSDGKVILGGSFTMVNGVRHPGIVRLDANGTLDNGFQTELSGASSAGSVSAFAVQSDGKVLIGGAFSRVNGVTRNVVARLNADGTLDGAFQHETSGASKDCCWSGSGIVNSVALQSDGNVLIGGDFTTVNGERRNGIARLNMAGTLDSGFPNELSGTSGGKFNVVYAVAVQGDSKVLTGGTLANDSADVTPNIARLNADGTLDSGFRSVSFGSEDRLVYSVAVQSDGKMLIGGLFTVVNGESRINVARLNCDGTLDSGFQNGLSGADFPPFGAHVTKVAVQSDGKVLIGGWFNTDSGASRNGIARLNADGSLDTGFLSGAAGVESLLVQSDGKVLIGGYFTMVNGLSRTNVARLNADGTLDGSFQNRLAWVKGGAGWFPSVSSIAVQSDGRVLIGGDFTIINGVSHKSIARLNTDGSLDRGFLDGLHGTDGYVASVAVQSDGKVIIGGSFTRVNGVPALGIARLWGSADVPPRIQSITRSDANVTLNWDALPNRIYRAQFKDAATAATWTDLPGDVSGSPFGTASKTDTTLGKVSQRFYRVVLLP